MDFEKGATTKKSLTIDDLVERAERDGLASLTSNQLEKLSTSGKIDPERVRQALLTRLTVAKIKTANRGPGRPSRREIHEKSGDDNWLRQQEDRIRGLTEDEAEAELNSMLSPAQNDLIMCYRLQRIVDAGGKAGSDAARLLMEMRKAHMPPTKRLVTVKIQTAG